MRSASVSDGAVFKQNDGLAVQMGLDSPHVIVAVGAKCGTRVRVSRVLKASACLDPTTGLLRVNPLGILRELESTAARLKLILPAVHRCFLKDENKDFNDVCQASNISL